jgi:hypothetical protein
VTAFPLLPWLALVATYVSIGRYRGASWWSIAATAVAVFLVVFLEFTTAFAFGFEGLLWTAAVAGLAVGAFVTWARLRQPGPRPRHGLSHS